MQLFLKTGREDGERGSGSGRPKPTGPGTALLRRQFPFVSSELSDAFFYDSVLKSTRYSVPYE